MKFSRQPDFFDVNERSQKLTAMGDRRVGLNAQIHWEALREELSGIGRGERKSRVGAKPYDVVLMFKMLVLHQLHNLSDDRIEYQIRDRQSFMRFLGLLLEDPIPDAKTLWVFREQIKKRNLMDALFASFHAQLAERGYVARAGQMIDATFVEVPRQRNTPEENAQVKQGETPAAWEPPQARAKLKQKDPDARWTRKNNQSHYGYTNPVNVDQEHTLIQAYAVTSAVHDSQVFEELLDQTTDGAGSKRAVYADSAYRSKDNEAWLASQDLPSHICEKGVRTPPR